MQPAKGFAVDNMERTPTRESSCRLSVIIPTYNGMRWLNRCLPSVLAHQPAGTEILVVDDGSTDDTATLVPGRWPEVRLLSRARNGGFCRAANHGLAHARGDVVELLNNDTEVAPGWAEGPLAQFADPCVGAVAPLVCQLPFRGRIDSAGDIYLRIGRARKRGEGASVQGLKRYSRAVFAASASAAFYRRSALERVGGFPEAFGAYLDDVDLGFRLRHLGFECVFCPESRVYHWVSRSHVVSGRRIQQQVARNSEILFWANLSARELLCFAGPHLAYLLLQLSHKTLRGDFGPWFAGKCGCLMDLPLLWNLRRRARALANGAPRETVAAG